MQTKGDKLLPEAKDLDLPGLHLGERVVCSVQQQAFRPAPHADKRFAKALYGHCLRRWGFESILITISPSLHLSISPSLKSIAMPKVTTIPRQ
jgi:hypothetical protein